ncbi:MAG: CinA family protein, partial [Dissulfuribacterales bacterium]
SRGKPVGTVHIGLASNEETFSGRYRFWGGRHQVKAQTAMMALDWVRCTAGRCSIRNAGICGNTRPAGRSSGRSDFSSSATFSGMWIDFCYFFGSFWRQ